MSKSGRFLMVALLSVAVIAANMAEAARLGGGRSYGMQRSFVSRSAPTRVAPQPVPPPAQQPQRSGPGWGGVAAGVAAGAATGYLVSKAMQPDAVNASGVIQSSPVEQQSGGIPWGMILALCGVAFLGARMLTRNRAQPVSASGFNAAGVQTQAAERKVFRMGEGMNPGAVPNVSGRLPDGTEAPAFLRQARASFQHIQSLNSPEQMEEVRKYLTPELFDVLKSEIGSNREVAEFHDLNADLLDSSHEAGHLVASVRFSGRVSESLNAPAVPFSEIWHFMRPSETDPRWVLAGIEQV